MLDADPGPTLTLLPTVVTGSYSAFNWGWERWERECDWMALHGVNLVVSFNGQELLWREAPTLPAPPPALSSPR